MSDLLRVYLVFAELGIKCVNESKIKGERFKRSNRIYMWVSFQCIFYFARTEIEMTLFTTHFQKKRDLTDYIFSQKISSRYFLTCFAFQSIIFIWGQMKRKNREAFLPGWSPAVFRSNKS